MIKLTRTKALVLLVLACALIVVKLILWRPFGSSIPSQSNQSEAVVAQSGTTAIRIPRPERVFNFPEDRSIGTLWIGDWNSTWRKNGWRIFREAQGAVTITVPIGKELSLTFYGYRDRDLSPLAEIGEHDIQSLDLSARSAQ